MGPSQRYARIGRTATPCGLQIQIHGLSDKPIQMQSFHHPVHNAKSGALYGQQETD